MNDSQAPDRLNYGWVVVLAFGMIWGGLYVGFDQSWMNPEEVRFYWGIQVFSGVIFTVLLSIWLLFIWAIHWKFRWRRRTWLALLPSALLFASSLVCLTSPRLTREEHLRLRFHRVFDAELPADARDVEATPPTLADSGHVDFVFRCSQQSIELLARAMNLEKQKGVAPHSSQLTHDWADKNWEDGSYYIRTDKKGVGCFLIPDSRRERVLVGRNPLFAKSEDEMHGVK